MFKRINALLAALAILCTCGSAGAEAMKKERVYAVTNAAGEVQTVIDNILLTNPEHASVIIDRTHLNGIENVGGHESFRLNGEELTWQAEGNSIRYQGCGTDAPAVVPAVTCTVDGRDIRDPAEASGDLTLQVTYALQGNAPILAITILPVAGGMSDIELENAYLADTGSGCYIIGYAVPGAEDILELPNSFSVHCSCDHPELSWMLTVASTEPAALLCDRFSGDVTDAESLVSDLTAWLTALSSGTEIPELSGDLQETAQGISALLAGADALADGAEQLNTGAASLADGTAQVKEGAARLAAGSAAMEQGTAALESGLKDLTAGSEALNAGAGQIFSAILTVANTQLAGLADAGISVPALTAENYAAVLDGAVVQLNEELQQGIAAAEAQVREAVMAQEPAIRETVSQAVRAKVLEGILKASGLDMTAEEYAAAASAGMIPADRSAQINAAAEAQMATEACRAQTEEALKSAIDDLTAQNMAAEEVQSVLRPRLEAAQAAIDALNGLKVQLDQVNTFVSGLAAYTAGVSQVQEGSVSLHSAAGELAAGAGTLSEGTNALNDGAVQLADGSAQLHDGAAQLQAGLRQAVEKAVNAALPRLAEVQNYLDAFRTAEAAGAAAGSYDLAAEGTDVETVYIIRSELK